MRFFLIYLILFVFGGSMLWAQSETNNTNTENSPVQYNYNTTNSVESLEEVEVAPDSTAAKPKRGKKYKVGTVRKVPVSTNKKAQSSAYKGVSNSSTHSSASNLFKKVEKDSDIQRKQRTPSFGQQQQMNDIVGYFETNAPASFEYNYFKYISGNYDVSQKEYLLKAAEIRPENVDVKVQLAALYMIENKPSMALMYLDQLIDVGKLDRGVIKYSEDLLRSTPQNGTLITHGLDDSYSTWYMQQKDSVRTDVTLISLDFLQSEAYRQQLENKGYSMPTSEVIDIVYLSKFCELNIDKGLCISMTLPKEYLVPIQSSLYVVGLGFEFHKESYNNFYKNDYLWNEEFNKYLVDNAMNQKTKQLSANYLPMLLQLRKVYSVQGEKEKLEEVDQVSDKIGVQCNKYNQVQKLKQSY